MAIVVTWQNDNPICPLCRSYEIEEKYVRVRGLLRDLVTVIDDTMLCPWKDSGGCKSSVPDRVCDACTLDAALKGPRDELKEAPA